ncbi:hypothetical protein WME97_17465 [Sorangium sp. So ce367]|uniref:hypothetical protein n=1 Tax=Sorangium sp. So ce367 TaxID=3133305 RepID=UPI003F60842A
MRPSSARRTRTIRPTLSVISASTPSRYESLISLLYRSLIAVSRNRFPAASANTYQRPSPVSRTKPRSSRARTHPWGPAAPAPTGIVSRSTGPSSLQTRRMRCRTSISHASEWLHPNPSPTSRSNAAVV